MIVFASDHGELMGDHHYFRKVLPYEGSARIPLIVCDPGGKLGLKRGIRPDPVVELRDLMPTLLDAAGAPLPAQVQGCSVLPLCRREQDVPWRSFLHGEHAFGHLSTHYVTDGFEKYIWFSQTGREQFFDLRQDPQETTDLIGQPERRECVSAWRQRLIDSLAGREEGYVRDGALVAGQKPVACLKHIVG